MTLSTLVTFLIDGAIVVCASVVIGACVGHWMYWMGRDVPRGRG